jgi:hypothetical protein
MSIVKLVEDEIWSPSAAVAFSALIIPVHVLTSDSSLSIYLAKRSLPDAARPFDKVATLDLVGECLLRSTAPQKSKMNDT